MGFGTILLIIIVVIAVLAVMAYNSLVNLRQRCRQAFADIDVQTKQRHDLVPNLVETVKGYAAHEKGTLDEVVKARAAAIAAPAGSPQQVEAEQALSGALGHLIAISEAYPDLKANQNFLELQQQLADIEGKIAAARRFYNGAVSAGQCRHPGLPGRALRTLIRLRARDLLRPGRGARRGGRGAERQVLEHDPQKWELFLR